MQTSHFGQLQIGIEVVVVDVVEVEVLVLVDVEVDVVDDVVDVDVVVPQQSESTVQVVPQYFPPPLVHTNGDKAQYSTDESRQVK
jgi:hypothetical protein